LKWLAVLAPTFKSGYGKLDKTLQKGVDEAIEDLLSAEEPLTLEHRLHGRWKGTLSYEIGRQYRINYVINHNQKIIAFLAVGTHKIY